MIATDDEEEENVENNGENPEMEAPENEAPTSENEESTDDKE